MSWPGVVPPALFAALSLALGAARLMRGRCVWPGFLGYLWAFLLVFVVGDRLSFTAAVWIMALISFRALREYFSLTDLRLEDRWGVLGAYVSIPFMFYLVAIDWYGFFIVSIPVYAFLVIPFLVTLGDSEGRGSVLSIGAIDFGVFFFVYCLGHIAYLAFYSTWMALFLVLAVAACSFVISLTRGRGRLAGFLVSAAACLALALALRSWTTIPIGGSLFVGVLIPVLVQMGDYTVGVLEHDLGVRSDDLQPGRGRVLDSLKAYLFTAPVVFHYLRWSIDFDTMIPGHGG